MLCGLRVSTKMQKQLSERAREMWVCPKERRGNGMNKKNTDTKQWIQEIREFVHEQDWEFGISRKKNRKTARCG